VIRRYLLMRSMGGTMGTNVTFRHAPVVETVLGVQFQRLRGLTNAHLGAFWEQRKGHWPHVEDAPPLDEQFETFGGDQAWRKAIQLRFTRSPVVRLQMKNGTGDRMIQVQNCRVDYNWIGRPGEEYPRYRRVRPEFDAVLRDFRKLITDHNLGELIPNQWEITYVNHMPKGTVWNRPEEWPGIFRLPLWVSTPSGTRQEGFGGHWHFEIEPQRGRLHVEIEHAYLGSPEGREALVMKLTARGPVDRTKEQEGAIDEGLNLGHDVVVNAFVELTSQQAQDYWNRECEYAKR